MSTRLIRKAQRAGLPVDTAASRAHAQIIGVNAVGQLEGTQDVVLEGEAWKVVGEVALVHADGAGASLGPDFGDRVFATTGCSVFVAHFTN